VTGQAGTRASLHVSWKLVDQRDYCAMHEARRHASGCRTRICRSASLKLHSRTENKRCTSRTARSS